MPKSVIIALVIVVVGLVLMQRPRGRETESRYFQWAGEVQEGGSVRLRNMNGRVTVEPSTDGRLEVRASRQWRGREPRGLRVEHVADVRNPVFCAMYSRGGTCSAESYDTRTSGGSWFRRTRDQRIDFVVRLPEGLRVDASTANGNIRIANASGDVTARAVNGSINAHTLHGHLVARTTNGRITIRVDSLTEQGVSAQTTNGTITAELPPQLNARLTARTVNGRVSTDFPMVVSGTVTGNNIDAVLGAGGPPVELRATNGRISIRRIGGTGEESEADEDDDAEVADDVHVDTLAATATLPRPPTTPEAPTRVTAPVSP